MTDLFTRRSLPFWLLAVAGVFTLTLGGLGWLLDRTIHKVLEAHWLSLWAVTFGLPMLALCAIGVLAFRRVAGVRKAAWGLLLVALLLQGGLLAWGVRAWQSHSTPSTYHSSREYAKADALPQGWADPAKPERYDLGGGLRLAMTTVCWVDAKGRTLPMATAPKLAPLEPDASQRPLDEQGVANLVALARTYGYVRFFHPSDGAAATDWHRLLLHGVRLVEGAKTPEELARHLRALFTPIAPTLRILAPGEGLAEAPVGRGVRLVRWKHHGLGPFPPSQEPFDRGLRLADVMLAWNVMQHFFPYFVEGDHSWAGELPRALREAALDGDERAFTVTLRRLTAPLKDGHVAAFRKHGVAPGQPALALVFVEGKPLVAHAEAEARALPLGSEILSVDGEDVQRRIHRLAPQVSAASAGWLQARLSWLLLSGPLPAVEVRFRAPDGREAVATLPRKVGVDLSIRDRITSTKELRPGVWYVDLDRVGTEAFKAVLPRLLQAQGIVFDLRGYPQDQVVPDEVLPRLTKVPLQSAHWNVPVVLKPDRQGWTWDLRSRWQLAPIAPGFRGRVVFLTGGGAISYAESCLGIVEAYRLADIVGEPTAGTNGNVNALHLPGGYTINWTGMQVLKHDGSPHHGVGIQPTVTAQPTRAGLAAGRDEVIEKGLAVLGLP